MKKLEKFESSKLSRRALYNIHGGEEFDPGDGGGGPGPDPQTGDTWSTSHADGVTDGDPPGGGSSGGRHYLEPIDG